MKKIFLTFMMSIGFCALAMAQDRGGTMFNIAWDVNVPVGDNFINATSWYGGKVEFRQFVKENVSVGLEVNWSSLYEYKPRKTYPITNGDVTTDAYKYLYMLPINVNAHYYFGNNPIIRPYAGVGIGATYSQQDIFFSDWELYDDNWGFLIRPEIGAIIKFTERSQVGLLVGVRYNYSTNKQTDFNMNGINTLSFQLGVSFMR